jgi:hypothetical protein
VGARLDRLCGASWLDKSGKTSSKSDKSDHSTGCRGAGSALRMLGDSQATSRVGCPSIMAYVIVTLATSAAATRFAMYDTRDIMIQSRSASSIATYIESLRLQTWSSPTKIEWQRVCDSWASTSNLLSDGFA